MTALFRQTALILLASGLGACSGPSSSDWFPLAEGMQWNSTFEFTTPAPGIQTGTSTIRVEGSDVIEGNEYMKVSMVLSGIPGIDPQINYYRKTRSGLYQIRDSQRDAGEFIAIPFPLRIGDSWKVQAAGLDLAYKAEAIVSVPLPDRTYENCMKLTFEGTVDGVHIEGQSFQAPGVGTVRQVEKYDSVTFEVRLKEFSCC